MLASMFEFHRLQNGVLMSSRVPNPSQQVNSRSLFPHARLGPVSLHYCTVLSLIGGRHCITCAFITGIEATSKVRTQDTSQGQSAE